MSTAEYLFSVSVTRQAYKEEEEEEEEEEEDLFSCRRSGRSRSSWRRRGARGKGRWWGREVCYRITHGRGKT